MKTFATELGSLLVAAGLLAAGPLMAQTPAASAPAETHNDPIVQKRMEVREANQAHRANRAEARRNFRKDVGQSRSERNAAVQDSRARAQSELDNSK